MEVGDEEKDTGLGWWGGRNTGFLLSQKHVFGFGSFRSFFVHIKMIPIRLLTEFDQIRPDLASMRPWSWWESMNCLLGGVAPLACQPTT